MDFASFKDSLTGPTPPAGLAEPLLGLWHAGRDDWDAAHKIVQSESSADCCWVHAYLHRVEGDLGNAGYWYRRAGRAEATGPLEVEWQEICELLLAEG